VSVGLAVESLADAVGQRAVIAAESMHFQGKRLVTIVSQAVAAVYDDGDFGFGFDGLCLW